MIISPQAVPTSKQVNCVNFAGLSTESLIIILLLTLLFLTSSFLTMHSSPIQCRSWLTIKNHSNYGLAILHVIKNTRHYNTGADEFVAWK